MPKEGTYVGISNPSDAKVDKFINGYCYGLLRGPLRLHCLFIKFFAKRSPPLDNQFRK